ncbi:hypothetical protein [Dendronalium sp. ChiSLP03b]|uniref:hypothetical protein n=1 Tax=Dendronalium sp. ChiSLP03b TaxID=3075381 RepID=UPI002AD54B38|nr:hypothetical protein [Dendronalium sp. ChiSLP03b]MDZ8205504.1 hypothetical protein [Dendronalium sp. ChiSLP03b]
MVRQSGLLPRGDAKSDGGFHATCFMPGNPSTAVAPHKELPLAQRSASPRPRGDAKSDSAAKRESSPKGRRYATERHERQGSPDLSGLALLS